MLPTVTPPEKNMHGSQERTYRKSGDVYLKNRNLIERHPNLKNLRKATLMRTELEDNRNVIHSVFIRCYFYPKVISNWSCLLNSAVCYWSDDVLLKSAEEQLNWAWRHKIIVMTVLIETNVGGYIWNCMSFIPPLGLPSAPEWRAKLHSFVSVGTRNQELLVMWGDSSQQWKLWQMSLYVYSNILMSRKMSIKGQLTGRLRYTPAAGWRRSRGRRWWSPNQSHSWTDQRSTTGPGTRPRGSARAARCCQSLVSVRQQLRQI